MCLPIRAADVVLGLFPVDLLGDEGARSCWIRGAPGGLGRFRGGLLGHGGALAERTQQSHFRQRRR